MAKPRCVLVVLDGAADRPRDALDGRTPLAVARTPVLDALAETGKVGHARIAPRGTAGGLECTIQTLLGLSPDEIVEGGGPFEAHGLAIELSASDVAYRMSLVTTLDGAIVDPTAGRIATPEARALVEALEETLAPMNAVLAAGEGHAHVLVARDRPEVAETMPPEAVVGRPVEENLPSGPEGSWLRGVMDRAGAVLSEHEVNRVRIDLGENPADAIWPWSGGRLVVLPEVPARIGRSVAAATNDPLVAGLAAQAALTVAGGAEPDVVLAALADHDLVVVHASLPAAARTGDDPGAKVRAIETFDRELLAPLVRGLGEDEPYRMLVVASSTSAEGFAPFLLVGEGVSSIRRFGFHEEGAAGSDLRVDEGHMLLDYLLARPARPGST